ncbi:MULTISPECIES: MBL fold metallo-hydrolase [Kordiimonas]|jgi:glyoxylase-like metal-dependent hydrolase (beta-lactamase superfamily II)|uniref:MBL fold metallo-hydrolase n=1 Tax=Kordiimonas TaxID=288021 RepID=UPI00257FCC70|nr:MBL fold metallo-hydrolase [Kordiimonas sp. UBA4487]
MTKNKAGVSKGEAKALAQASVADHRRGVVEDDGLLYPHGDAVPEGSTVIPVADGVYWARMPLPWSLDHINVYLFDEGDSWSVVDTGSMGKRGIAAWEALETDFLGGKPISRVIGTHLHPDHIGLAGWLAERFGASLTMTALEYMTASNLWMGGTKEVPDNEIEFMLKSGVDPQFEPMMRSARFDNYRRGVHQLPPRYIRVEDGSDLMLGGRRWRVVIGRGHSPEHACLSCLDEPLFISGDQVLPNITSNVSVHAREPEANPLAHWITSLERMKGIPGDPLVLPSHGRVFKGLETRLTALVDSHLGKLKSLHDWCSEARTPVETFPSLFRRKLTGMDFYMALGEALAHLHLLESLSLMKRSFDGDVYRFEAVGTYDASLVVSQAKALPGVALRELADIY